MFGNNNNNSNNNGLEFLDLVTIAGYLMNVTSIDSTNEFRYEIYKRFDRIENKLDIIIKELNHGKEN